MIFVWCALAMATTCHVQLLGEADANGDRAVTDSLTVEKYYIDNSAKIERLEFEDGTVWDASDFILARIRGGSVMIV